MNALEITRNLIRCRSITPVDDGALAYIIHLLQGAGFVCERSRSGDVDNLYARLGQAQPCFAFAGHTDVVPPGDVARWRFDPFAAEVEAGRLYGRGAADMKGGVAATLAATLRFVEAGAFHGSIAFLITGNEEGLATDGTVRLVEMLQARGEKIDHCVLAEPTSQTLLGDMIKIGRRGSLNGRVRLVGKPGHSAYPHLANNPARALPQVLQALFDKPLDSGTADFLPSNLEVTTIDTGNPATNVIPGEICVAFNIRFNDLWTPQTLAQEIAQRLDATQKAYELTFIPTNALSFLTPHSPFTSLVVEAVEHVAGRRPVLSTTGGTSDARFIKDLCPVIELGLPSGNMHGIDEYADVADLEKLTQIYERILQVYFGT